MNVTARVSTFQCELISTIIILYDANLLHYREYTHSWAGTRVSHYTRSAPAAATTTTAYARRVHLPEI